MAAALVAGATLLGTAMPALPTWAIVIVILMGLAAMETRKRPPPAAS